MTAAQVAAETAPGAAHIDDDALLDYIRAEAYTVHHPVSSCRMGTDPQAVVDRLGELHEMGFGQVVLFAHDRASDATLELLAAEVLPRV